LVKKFKEKGVLIPVEKERGPHEKRPEKKISIRNMSTCSTTKDSLTFPRKRGSFSLTFQGGTRYWLSNVYHEWIPFLDILGLLSRSWQRYEANYIANELFRQVHLATPESQEVWNNPRTSRDYRGVLKYMS
jgi:hypothetical protein